MIKVLYIPLDERACNYEFPQKLCEMTEDLELLVPSKDNMGCLKKPASVEILWDWLFNHAIDAQYAILSVDTLVYGNIINSRTHHLNNEDCAKRLSRFKKLKQINPELEIYAFNLVARVAAYNNSHEDPDYWESHGWAIWRYTYLTDKIARGDHSQEEIDELAKVKDSIPEDILADFLTRRNVDRTTNLACVDLVSDNIFKLLTIPKDDTAEYGYAAMDQAAIAEKVRERHLTNRVLIYPGADEVGSVLFARIFNRVKQYTPKVYVRYSSTLGPTIVPNYEDRPLHESIKWQITSLGGIVEDCAGASDCMLAVNSPGKYQIESGEQYNKDLTFKSHMNIPEFLGYIHYYSHNYKKAVGIAEVSVCNGCENEFMDSALEAGIYDDVQAVGGWNTAQNTIGVVLAQTVIASYYNCFENKAELLMHSEEFKLRSIVCDWLYQSNVLHQFYFENLHAADKIDLYFLKENYEKTRVYFTDNLRKLIAQKFPDGYKGLKIQLDNLYFDWDGVFYINFKIYLKQQEKEGAL